MSVLPKELENIIFKYHHNLLVTEILDDIQDMFYNCDYCNHNKIYNKMNHCTICKIAICEDCCKDLLCTEQNLCNECYLEESIFEQVDSVLLRMMSLVEFETIGRLIYGTSEYVKHELLDYICYLKNMGHYTIYTDFNELLSVIIIEIQILEIEEEEEF